jgi:hypothetical protein
MPTTSNFGWTTPADTDLVKDGAAAIRTLGNGIDTSFLDLKGGTTDQVLAKNSNTDLDFKWVSDATGIQATIFDAKGDLIAASAADTAARLAVGANGTYLSADSAETTGLKWVSPPAAGGLTLISETVASAVSSITFSAISGSYKQLLLVWAGVQHSGVGSDFGIRFNNNSNGVYATSGLADQNTGTYTNVNINILTSAIGNGNFFPFGSDASGATLISSVKGTLLLDNYASSTKAKTYQCSYSYNDQNVGEKQATILGIFNSTTAVTSLEIVRITGTDTISNQADTTIRLYGVS